MTLTEEDIVCSKLNGEPLYVECSRIADELEAILNHSEGQRNNGCRANLIALRFDLIMTIKTLRGAK